MIKKMIACLLIGLILCVCSVAFSVNADVPETYVMGGQLYANTIIETDDGNVWKIDDGGAAAHKQEVRVVFDSKGTNDQRDDEILEVITM